MRFRIVPDAIVRALELRKGSADVAIDSLSPDMAATLAKERGIVAEEQPGTTVAYIGFNFEDPVLSHREVRQALAYATDRATLIKYLLRGQARPAASLLPPNHWAYDPNVTQYDFDPARADQLLDAAGFPRGADGVRFHIEFKTSTDETSRLLSEAIADEWKNVGVEVELRPLEFATFYADLQRGSFQLSTQRWVGGNNDPDIFNLVFNSKKIPPNGLKSRTLPESRARCPARPVQPLKWIARSGRRWSGKFRKSSPRTSPTSICGISIMCACIATG